MLYRMMYLFFALTACTHLESIAASNAMPRKIGRCSTVNIAIIAAATVGTGAVVLGLLQQRQSARVEMATLRTEIADLKMSVVSLQQANRRMSDSLRPMDVEVKKLCRDMNFVMAKI